MIPTANFYLNPKATFYTNAKKMQTHLKLRSTVGPTAVYHRTRAVSRPDRAGASRSGRGVAYRSSRAVYHARDMAYRRRRLRRSLQTADWKQRATDGCSEWLRVTGDCLGATSTVVQTLWATWALTGRSLFFSFFSITSKPLFGIFIDFFIFSSNLNLKNPRVSTTWYR
jgi:hypothetical protein